MVDATKKDYYNAVKNHMVFVKTVVKDGIRYRRFICKSCSKIIDVKVNYHNRNEFKKKKETI